MGEFVSVALESDVVPGQGRRVIVNDRWIGLFNIGGTFHAIDDICLHRGGPLSEGQISGTVVTCPWHGWQFNLTNGALVQDPQVVVTRHETRVVDGHVQVRLTDEKGDGCIFP